MRRGLPGNASGVDAANLERMVVEQYRPDKPATATVHRVRRGPERKFSQTDSYRGEVGEDFVSLANLGYDTDEIIVKSYFRVDADVELRVKYRASTGIYQYEVRMYYFRTSRRRLAVSVVYMRPKQEFRISGPWPFGSINYRIGYTKNDPTKPVIPAAYIETKKAS